MFKSKVAQASSTVVLKPLGAGQLIKIDNGKVVGRSERCDVVINHSGISRQHARLIPGKWEIQVQDLDSINGTYVNDQKVSGQMRARHKDKVRFDTLVYEVWVVVDIDDIANIDNTRPPTNAPVSSKADSLNNKSNDFVFASSLAQDDIDDMEVIQDTVPPSASNTSKPANKTVKPHPAEMPSMVARTAAPVDTDNAPLRNKTALPRRHNTAVPPAVHKHVALPEVNKTAAPGKHNTAAPPAVHKTAAPPLLNKTVAPAFDRTAAPSRVKPRSNTGLSTGSGQSRTGSRTNSRRRDRSFAPRSLISQSQSTGSPNWAVADNRRFKSLTGAYSGQARRETVQMGVIDKSISLEKGGAVFVGLSGVAKGSDFSFSARDHLSKWEIGRAESCDVMINDSSVSRNHAQLVSDKGRWKLIDLMSANGTYVNDNKCLTSYLDSGDTVRFGKLEFMFKSSTSGKNKRSEKRRPGTDIGVVLLFAVVLGVVLFGFFSTSL